MICCLQTIKSLFLVDQNQLKNEKEPQTLVGDPNPNSDWKP